MQYIKTLSWDDYRYVLAISRAGGVSGAVDSLGVNTSTVFRRLDKIEQSVQTLLFDRARRGYVPTAAGKEVIHAAEIMEQATFAADRIVTGHDQQLTGQIRITATETLATCFLTRHVKSFHEKHPGLTVNISSENRVMSLAEREADIALRPRRPSDETLIGRKIASLGWGIFGNAELQNTIGKIKTAKDLAHQPFIVWDGGALAKEFEDWVKRSIPDVDLAFRSSSMLTNAQMAATGVGLVALPCIVGAVWPGLVPVLSPLDDLGTSSELWLVIHEDMRHNARVRALIDHLVATARQDAGLFMGANA
jgi:DNA-binding transcriptional LysR family regulator